MTSTEVTFETTEFERQLRGYSKELTRTDVLQAYINLLEMKELQKDFQGAGRVLDNIKKLLDEPEAMGSDPEESYCRTLLAVHHMVRSNPIRLRYEDMDISGYLKLLQKIKERLFNQKISIPVQRKVVAEEMSKLGLFPQLITDQWQLRETKPPNRAFLDVLYKVRPEFAKDELLRREYSKLCNAWNRGNKKELLEIRKKIKELGGEDFTKELEK